jgi:hypothetical protein
LADDCWIEIDLNKTPRKPFAVLRVRDHVKPRPDDQRGIRAIKHVAVEVAQLPPTVSQRQRVVVRHDALGEGAGDHRRAEPFGDALKIIARAGAGHAAAGIDDRSLCPAKDIGGLLDSRCVTSWTNEGLRRQQLHFGLVAQDVERHL